MCFWDCHLKVLVNTRFPSVFLLPLSLSFSLSPAYACLMVSLFFLPLSSSLNWLELHVRTCVKKGHPILTCGVVVAG